jgi:hypothetical protein
LDRLESPQTLSDYLGSVLAPRVRAAYYYDNSMYVPAAIGDDMKVGYGYWVALSDGGTIYPSNAER